MILEINNLRKAFGGIVAVNQLNFAINEGDIVGLLGPNGSGKTTTFSLISGYLTPDQGQIKFDGKDITGMKPYQICQLGITRTFQLTKPFLGMTALENVKVGSIFGNKTSGSMRKIEKECKEILEITGLGGKEDIQARTLGVVERKRLEVARALATKPKILLLDEMMSGLTPAEMEDALDLVLNISKSGVTLIVVEHVIKAILKISNHLIVLNYGEKISEGDPQTVIKDKVVIEAYLGA